MRRKSIAVNRPRGTWPWILSMVMVGATGCLLGSFGDLGQEVFHYDCAGPSDPYCDHEACEQAGELSCGGLETHHEEIPRAIATGASFTVSSGGSWVTSTSPAMVSGAGGWFTARTPGRVALLAHNGGGVYDFIYLTIATPNLVRLTRVDTGGAISAGLVQLTPGERAWIRAVPEYSGGALSGALPCAWQVEAGEAAVALRGDPGDNIVQLEATSDGTATVSVTLGSLIATVHVRVGDSCVGECCVPTGCDPMVPSQQCCPDDYGQALECVVTPGSASGVCLLPCVTSQDCTLSSACDATAPSHCQPVPCGDAGQGWPGEVEALCRLGDAPDAAQGVCVGAPRADPDRTGGLCREAGTLAPGEACTVPADPFTVPRWEPSCAFGVCEATPGGTDGVCVGLCDWERHYEVAVHGADATSIQLPCAQGYECVSSATLDPESGLRQPGVSRCTPSRSLDPIDGVTACSLITGALVTSITSITTSCASALGQPEADCLPTPTGPAPAQLALGTLIGTCDVPDPSQPPNRGVWEDCADTFAICPPRTQCADESGLVGAPSGTRRCLPYCDVASAGTLDASCVALIEARNPGVMVGGTLGCVSWSLRYDDPANGLLGGLDRDPTRLGVCQVMP